MRIVVTGGAGFIGSHLCEFLLSLGHKVICIDNFITGTHENISQFLDTPNSELSSRESRVLKGEFRCLSELPLNFKLIEQDVTKYLAIDDEVDWVLHFASPASPIDYQRYPIQTLKVGALGTHNALGLAKAKGAKFLLASTSEVYGDPACNPQPETYWGNVNPIGPRGVYDEAKRFAEAMTMAYHRVHKIDTRIARIFNTYGERMRADDGRVVPNFIIQSLKGESLTVYGDGKQTRSFCYIKDLIDGLWRLMNSNISEPVNLGNPNEFSILEFAELVLRLTGSKSKISYLPLPINDPQIRCPDISLAKAKLDWTPKTSLEQGIKITIQCFKLKM